MERRQRCRSLEGRNTFQIWPSSGVIMITAVALMTFNLTLVTVNAGVIVKRQLVNVETTTIANAEETTTAAILISDISEQVNASESRQADPSPVVTVSPEVSSPESETLSPGVGSTRSDAPTTVVAPTKGQRLPASVDDIDGRSFARSEILAEDATDLSLAVVSTAASDTQAGKSVASSAEPEATVAETTTVTSSLAEEPVATVVSLPQAHLVSDEGLQVVTDSKDSNDGEAENFRFDLSRYSSPSNYSQGGISLGESRSAREQFFAERSDEITTELPGELLETTSTQEPLASDESVTELVKLETNEIGFPDVLIGTNHTLESNRTVRLNRSEVESTDYELVSNEVRNQTTLPKGKKGKFLDQFGATEDNDINGAAWALAGMRIVERTSNKGGQAAAESVEVVRDDGENAVANNTLKQLIDWAVIMQDADFANSSFVRPTSGEVDLKNELKDRRRNGSKTPTVGDALSEENRLTSLVTEMMPAGNVGTTVAPATSAAEDDGLEDFKFEERAKLSVESTKRPDLTNFIQETTTAANARVTQVVTTTMRSTRDYEVSEDVDENVKFALPTRTTTSRFESSTVFEDMPITTYSPLSPILRKTEAATESWLPTTFESMRTRRPLTTTTTQAPTTVRTAAETLPPVTTTTATSASTDIPLLNELFHKENERENSSPEVDTAAIKQFNSDLSVTTSTATSPTQFTQRITEPIVPQESTVQPTAVEFRPAVDGTTDGVDLTNKPTITAEVHTNPNQPVLIDEKNVYNTDPETTDSPVPEPEPSSLPESEPTSEPSTTTARSNVRTSVTTELSEEESVTEEDYVDLSGKNASAGSSSKSPLDAEPSDPPQATEEEEGGSGVVIAVVASLLSVALLLLLVAAYVLLRKRQAQVSYGQRCRPVGLDAYSLDNVSVYNSVRRKGNTLRMSKRSYGNSAFEDPGLKTNPLTVAELANIIQNKTAMYDEFKEIPNVTARADEVPEGCEDKNRYANVVPLPETRVHLKRINEDEKTEYINANFVKGPKDNGNYYIACQAPMENTINDFWRMMWEQNSKVIIMATDLSENGVEKCAEYLPPSVVLDNNRTFGDFQLTLKNRENKEKYTISTVHLRNTQTGTWREIMHFWYQWPDTGVPIDESSIIAMLLEARSYSRLAPAEMADVVTGIIGSIAEEDGTESDHLPATPKANGSATDSSVAVVVGSNSVDSSVNNNNNNNKTVTADSAAPNSLVSNGGTMDKHKSLQRTQGPITVHCSPGTGRTGTIIACDVALRAVEIPPRTVDIPHIVYYVRRGRASAVRTREQYELIYRVANVYATKLTGPTIET
ncbi:mucin-5AC isoform X2 [Wyeomyia smithii]|uniref:mucin-5AC isoform X2 n=1 Tax=Wyeomyia smithii TaxID=174621 RepID=UPI002468226B|nr:mucin-5AC isoform X2 [Wyeomyia smithii]